MGWYRGLIYSLIPNVEFWPHFIDRPDRLPVGPENFAQLSQRWCFPLLGWITSAATQMTVCLIRVVLISWFVKDCDFTVLGPVFFFSSPSLGSCRGTEAASGSQRWDRCLCAALLQPPPPAAADPQLSSGRPTLGWQSGSLPSGSVRKPFLGHRFYELPSACIYTPLKQQIQWI